MKTSQNGIDLIKRFEGLELEAYQDIAGIWTIGYGHTGPDVQPGMKISERDAEEMLKRDLLSREDAVSRLVRTSLNQNEFDALVSFVYNVGAEAFRKSTALRRLNAGDRVGAAEALTWFNKATVGGVLRAVTGLTRRRAAERALFLEPVSPPLVTDNDQLNENSRVRPVEDPPRRPSLGDSRSIQGATVAGGAGVAATTMGRDSASELNELENNIESGEGLTAEDGGIVAAPGGEATDAVGDPVAGDAEAATGDAGSEDVTGGEDIATDSAPEQDEEPGEMLTESIGMGPERPSAHEKHAAQEQIQLALLVLIVLSVLYIVFARIDDWWKYRR